MRLLLAALVLVPVLSTGAAVSGPAPVPSAQSALLGGATGAGLDPILQIEEVRAMVLASGLICFNFVFGAQWVDGVPPQFFSWFLQIWILDLLFGVQNHDTLPEAFSQVEGEFVSGLLALGVC